MTFFGISKPKKQKPEVEQLLLNALNKTNRDWAARGMVEKSH